MAMKGISTWLECVRLPIPSAFIVYLDVQLFVSVLARSSPSISLPVKDGLSDVHGTQLVYIYGRHIALGRNCLTPVPLRSHPESPQVFPPWGSYPLQFQLSAYKDDALRASSLLSPCRAVALGYPPVPSEVAEHSFPFRYRLVARL